MLSAFLPNGGSVFSLASKGVDVVREDDENNLIPAAWRESAVLVPLDACRQWYRELEEAKRMRQTLTAYFNSPAGSVSWQDERMEQRLYFP